MQERTLKTRARLIEVAQALVASGGYEALRVEDVVSGAGVAKGTFFAHFKDKDALMERLVGAELAARLDRAEVSEAPVSVATLIAALRPFHRFMTSERYVFDLILRYSGAAAIAEIGPIAQCLQRYSVLVTGWIEAGAYRRDISADLLAEGVQAFAVQAMSLQFCALHRAQDFEERLTLYLDAWMAPAA
ncbi:TetR/AcrR family transcriptional regulator [Sedimentitalea sp. XS_ASV28]|uniref:TetR/AcrR family transcriptional regulator n=1 Tax=Sedimentitalea sp. XS_ASV28 TaxID=3241296 RepID=UPI0035148BCE